MNSMQNAVIYHRTDGEDTAHDKSQTDSLRRFAEGKGLTVVGEFLDTKTAPTGPRTQFLKMVPFLTE